ncbi:MAG: hypothetical protein ACI30I_05455 [Parabacteroides sp.]
MIRTLFCIVGCFLSAMVPLQSQIVREVYQKDYHFSPEQKGELRVEVDNLSFFRDNEFSTPTFDGYTLPGFWAQPKVLFFPLHNIKLEAGLHLLRYWGAERYPNMAYQDIAEWKGRHQDGVHLLPFFRAQVALSDHVDIVLGNLYGGANHRLIEPIYASELNLTADPEAGLQVLYQSRRFDMDLWVNWESFIFRGDTHQEAFTVGLSSRYKLNSEESPLHYYISLQGVIQHRGGEIDTILTQSVQTLMNGAVGVGAVWHIGHPLFREAEGALHALGYYQQAGSLWPFEQGAAFHASAALRMGRGFQVKGAYFYGNKFISLFGYPFYGTVSTKTPGMTFDTAKTGYVGLEYAHTFAPGFALGIHADLYLESPRRATRADGEVTRCSRASSFAAGVCLRVNPSFLIKKFE